MIDAHCYGIFVIIDYVVRFFLIDSYDMADFIESFHMMARANVKCRDLANISGWFAEHDPKAHSDDSSSRSCFGYDKLSGLSWRGHAII